MLVYRVELCYSTVDGCTQQGPYTRYSVDKLCDDFYNEHFKFFNHLKSESFSDDRCPEPRDDGLSRYSDEYIYGFASLEDLTNWFNGSFTDIQEAGFYIAVYSTSDVQFGNKQVRFNKETAKLHSFKTFDTICTDMLCTA